MIFCSNCFKDAEIKTIIDKLGVMGDCPLCQTNGIHIYDSSINNELDGIFDNLLSVYTPVEDLPEGYPNVESKDLVDIMANDWNIFSDRITSDDIINILKSLSPDMVADFPSLFNSPVGIAEKYDLDYIKKASILPNGSWDEFVESIKHKNRFHSNLINTDILKEYCLHIEKNILAATKQHFYRGRIAPDSTGYKPKEMGAPPAEITTGGRANAAGISRLYLSYKKNTTFHEIRAAEYDYVTVGTFKLKKDIKVVDLKQIGNISPFLPDMDCTALAINREHLQKINSEISKTMRRNDSPLDYIPTQYISDFIMSITNNNGSPLYDGIEYDSAMQNGGANLTIFDPSLFRCTYTQTYEVSKLTYRKKRFKKVRM